jgi:hypothetical protein
MMKDMSDAMRWQAGGIDEGDACIFYSFESVALVI